MLSTQPDIEEELQIDEENNSFLFSSLEEALEFTEEESAINEIFVIGGSQIYKETEKFGHLVKNIFETRVGQNFDGDAKLSRKMFDWMEQVEVSKTFSENGVNFDFRRLINPKLFSECYEEYQEKVIETEHQEYEYTRLVQRIINEGKSPYKFSLTNFPFNQFPLTFPKATKNKTEPEQAPSPPSATPCASTSPTPSRSSPPSASSGRA